MSAIEILKNLFFIERGYLNANHFVYRSDEPILIDTAYVSDFKETERLITGLGTDLSTVRLIINTHCHCDHIGGNKIIQERSGCDVWLHKIGKHFIDTRDNWATWWKYYDQEADFFTCSKALEDGDTIPVGLHEFRVIHTPGHAADAIALYSRKEKILISSDTLWENDLPVMTMRVEGSRALFSMYDSLERLESLDVRVVFPGHGKPFTRVNEAILTAKGKIKKYMNNKEALGMDLLKKIIVYTVLMHKAVDENDFFRQLMKTYWFKETVDLYFNGEYKAKYHETINGFLQRNILSRSQGKLTTNVKA